MRTSDGVWRDGERAAYEAYRRRGFRVLARNWRSPLGELDLVVRRDGLVVFCEVKARTGGRLGGPFEAVTAAKQRKLRLLAEAFLAAHPQLRDLASRFDVASVTARAGESDIHLFEDAF